MLPSITSICSLLVILVITDSKADYTIKSAAQQMYRSATNKIHSIHQHTLHSQDDTATYSKHNDIPKKKKKKPQKHNDSSPPIPHTRMRLVQMVHKSSKPEEALKITSVDSVQAQSLISESLILHGSWSGDLFLPNVTDRDTLISLAAMSWDAYTTPENSDWADPGMNEV